MIPNPNGRLVVVSIIALLHTCIQDCSSRPLPGEGRSSPEEWQWLSYSLEVPESPRDYTYHDMAFRSGPDSPQFPYTHIPPLHENEAPGSSHGLHHDYREHITNAYHQPSSSHTVEHHYSNQPTYNDMSNQHWNPLSEPEPIVEQQPVHQQGMHRDQINHFFSGHNDESDQHWNSLSEIEPIVKQQTVHQQGMQLDQINHFFSGHNDESDQHWNSLSEIEPIVKQQTVHQQGMQHDQINHFFSGHNDESDQHGNPLSETEPIAEQQTVHQQGMHHGQISHFTGSDSMPDMDFGWLSTLSFPSVKRLDALRKDDWGLSTILSGQFNLGAIPALKKNAETADKNLRKLLREIDTRNKQFLVFFTPANWNDFIATIQQHHSYHDMQDENASLLQWLLDQLELVPQSKWPT
ncbi:hypothetical protein PCASD_22940 [Puccinia coronata f. sp. avenae]|uniref:Uncharacterized protein n=1 Tax=Puccinia coronata f. sp. avenae TaxID=200324 RepID=A0A2N5TMA2_9BASI|nr:hypothetical protein PCASD_22940 [Puccinia coronata f. sp. avenae]